MKVCPDCEKKSYGDGDQCPFCYYLWNMVEVDGNTMIIKATGKPRMKSESTYHGIPIPGGPNGDIAPSEEWIKITKKCRCSECRGWLMFWIDHEMIEKLND